MAPLTFSPRPRVFRTPAWARYFSLVATLALGAITAFMLGVTVFSLFESAWGLAALAAALSWLMAALTGYVLRDLKGKWSLRVELGPQAVRLDLPAGRSLIHRPAAVHRTIPYGDIAAIESRLEAYGTIGMEIMQRAYVLRHKDGELIFLFEDRALGTSFDVSMFPQIAADLAAHAHLAIHELGMVEGKGGVLAVWGTQAPAWSAPTLPLARQIRLWRHSALTGSAAVAITIFALILRFIVGP